MELLHENFNFGTDSTSITLNSDEIERLRIAYKTSLITDKKGITTNYNLYKNFEPISLTALKIISEKAGISWSTYSHTGIEVPVRVIGQGQTIFSGNYDNTDIPKKIAYLMGINF